MKKLIVACFLISAFISSQAFGYTINFGDGAKYWPGWNNNTSDDNKDVIGVPNFTGGSLEITNIGYLTKITFN
ncbi:MAG: hypothetical protein FJ117_14055 [Deltaproteobacteria bacterium]|nr:hypothetical protein [Deltaproteobacteria bacterium]